MAARGARAAEPSECGASACSQRRRDDPEVQARISAFLQGLKEFGWTDGRNVRIDYRWGEAMPTVRNTRRNWSRSRRMSSWPVAARPGPVAASDAHSADRVCRSSPIRSAPDSSRAWHGRAAMQPASSRSNTALGAKWLELLKQIAPSVTRVAVIRDPALASADSAIRRHPGRGAVGRGGE